MNEDAQESPFQQLPAMTKTNSRVEKRYQNQDQSKTLINTMIMPSQNDEEDIA